MVLPGEGLAPPNTPPSYESIDREIEKSLLSEAISSNPELADSTAPYVLMTVEGDSPYANVARSLECQVFNEYFKNHPEVMQQEYAPYEDNSSFFLMISREELEPAGVMRVTHNSEAGFKSTNDLSTEKCKTAEGQPVTGLSTDEIFTEFGIVPENTLDVATIAANPKYGEKTTGSPLVLASLMRALHQYTHQNNYDDLIAIIDSVPLEKLQAVGLPIKMSQNVTANFEYLGAKGNSFIHIPVGEVDESVSAKSREVFDYVFGAAALMGECKLSMIKQ